MIQPPVPQPPGLRGLVSDCHGVVGFERGEPIGLPCPQCTFRAEPTHVVLVTGLLDMHSVPSEPAGSDSSSGK